MVAPLILVVAVRVAVMDDIEPVTPPAFTVMGRRQQAIDESVISFWTRVVFERVYLVGRGRQAVKIIC